MVRDFSKKIEFEVQKPILNQGVKSLGLIDIPRRRWCCLPRSFLPHSPFKGKKGLPTNVWCHTITYSAVHMLQKWAKRTLARTLFRLAKFSENLASLKTLLEERELRYFFSLSTTQIQPQREGNCRCKTSTCIGTFSTHTLTKSLHRIDVKDWALPAVQ